MRRRGRERERVGYTKRNNVCKAEKKGKRGGSSHLFLNVTHHMCAMRRPSEAFGGPKGSHTMSSGRFKGQTCTVSYKGYIALSIVLV